MTSTVPPATLVTLPSTASADDITAVTQRDGAVIVREVLSPEEVAQINAQLDPYLREVNPELGYGDTAVGFFGKKTKRLEGLVQKSDAVVAAILDDRLQQWVRNSLTWGAEYQLNTAQLIEIWPGEPAQQLHRDELLWPQIAGGEHELMVSCMFALTDFTEENGATRVAPGTNRDQRLDPATLTISATAPAVMAAGDALYFTGKVIHGGGANTTRGCRRGLTVTHGLGWLKSEEAQPFAVSLERARALPARMRELISFAGYRPYGPEAGVVSYRLDMDDPYSVLFNETRPPCTSRSTSPHYSADPITTTSNA